MRRWVALWDRREHPRSLGLLRLLLGAVVLLDLLEVGALDLVGTLWGPTEDGGLMGILGRDPPLALFEAIGASASVAWGLWGGAVAAAACLALGVAARPAALGLVLISAQLAQILPAADRGVDMLVRNALCILVFARSAEAWSLPARLRTGRWDGAADARVPAWPRYLVILQLVILYAGAGISKTATSWTPFGDWSALYIAMRDPAFGRLDADLVRSLYPATQALTAVTWLWEWAAPLLLLAYFYRDSRGRPGWLRALLNRVDFVFGYLLIGAIFHVGTHLTLRLGIFPFAALSLYPAAFHPDEWARWLRLRRD
jgi:hypothetical protein